LFAITEWSIGEAFYNGWLVLCCGSMTAILWLRPHHSLR